MYTDLYVARTDGVVSIPIYSVSISLTSNSGLRFYINEQSYTQNSLRYGGSMVDLSSIVRRGVGSSPAIII